ncbi:leucine-rich repeat domain-containing protein [Spirosoma sp. BT702]|uniref:Leucine-rich repeat domain-containing protein n=1 Tax=Spirosoma profusum TaxID=2771354 RepID=A0A927AWL9_9BACT|nr:leucine-rich repeat domain-containing protein [Spirosoma profusum]MBD2705716.1 leucine-rich repeat domain-containing protein [Spirosoma profusum]
MAKFFLWVLLALFSLSSLAQERVFLVRDTTRLNVSLAELTKKYSPALARVAGQQSVFATRGRQFLDTLTARNQRFYSFIERNKKRLPFPGLLLQTQEFVRPDGTFELVFCQFSGKELTEQQEAQLVGVVAEWYVQNPFPFKTTSGFRWNSMTSIGSVPQKRTVRRAPGVINTLEAAEKTTRPDTVKMLAFNQLDLTNVPEVVYRFPNLEELDLSKNALHELPARLTADIPTLRRLSLLYNSIPDDSVFITRNKHLQSLNLQGNKLTKIPVAVRQNRRLESLWLGNNKLKELDIRSLRRMRRLTDLNLYNAGLTTLPRTVRRLKHVKVLDLYYNKLTVLPRQLGRMKRLEQLAVAHNELKELPASLTKLRRLQVLYVHHNRLSQLPTDFQRLRYLRILDLGYNWYTVVPNVLASLPSLEELSLNNNNVQEFPTVLLSIKGLKKVYMGSNPLFGREAMNSIYAPQIKQLEANNTQVTY